jgi:hypothetical protein
MSDWNILSQKEMFIECKKLGLCNNNPDDYKKLAEAYDRKIIKLPLLEKEKNEKIEWYLLHDDTFDCQHIKPAFDNISPLFELLSNINKPVKITYYAAYQINPETTARFIWSTTNKFNDITYNSDLDVLKPVEINFDGNVNIYQSLCLYSTKISYEKVRQWFEQIYAYDNMSNCERIFLYNKPNPPHDIVYLEMLKSSAAKDPYVFNINIDQPGLYIMPKKHENAFMCIYNATLNEFKHKKYGNEYAFMDAVKRKWYSYFTDKIIKETIKKLWENINMVYITRGTKYVY